jgi:hypothetical protein
MKLNFTLFFLLLSVFAFSQDSSFQLNDYKYRTPGYKALAVSVNFSGAYSKLTKGNNNSRSRNLNLNPANLSYAKVVSTNTRLHQSSLALQSTGNFSGKSDNGKESRSNRFYPLFSWSRNDRFYRANGWFLEAGNELSIGYYMQSGKDTLSRYNYKTLNVQDNLILGVGKGRIENVQDAQMALYLLQDLSAQHLLNRTPTADEARMLAQLITDINNKRVFDSRRRRIYELTRLDSFFRNSGLAPQTDIRHFTTINDNWAFALSPGRLSGASWYLRLQPGVFYQHSSDNDFAPIVFSSKENYTTRNLSPVVGYENYHPISLRWQRNINLSLAFSTYRQEQTREEIYLGNKNKTSITFNNWSSRINALYGIGFYPNNRTLINGSFNVESYIYGNRDFILIPSLQFDAQYFISFRTYFTASASAKYNYQDLLSYAGKVKYRDFSSRLSVSVSHIIF